MSVKLEVGRTYVCNNGLTVSIHNIVVQSVPAIVPAEDDLSYLVNVQIAVGRSPSLRGRLYYFAVTGKRVGTQGGSTDIASVYEGTDEIEDEEDNEV
jgi:hypothetical protein